MTPDEIAGGIDDTDKLAKEGRALWAHITWHPEHIASVEPHDNIVDMALELLHSIGYIAYSDDRHLRPRKYGVFLKANWQVEIPRDDVDEFVSEGGYLASGHLFQAPWIRVEVDAEENDLYPDNDDVTRDYGDIYEDVEHAVGIDDEDDLGTLADSLNAADIVPVRTKNAVRLHVDSWTRLMGGDEMPLADVTDKLVDQLGITDITNGYSRGGIWAFWVETAYDRAFFSDGEWLAQPD